MTKILLKTSKTSPQKQTKNLQGRRRKWTKRIVRILIIVIILFAIIFRNAPKTLSTLKKVDDYPLYTMQYHGRYDITSFLWQKICILLKNETDNESELNQTTPQACSLFAALGDNQNPIYGRNFDWAYSPALLLFTDPSDGYASLSLTDLAYLGFDKQTNFDDPPLKLQLRLLVTPIMPFEGINEHGLTVAIAAVPRTLSPIDPNKKNIHSLHAIRLMLDHAKNTNEAVAILEKYNIIFEPGPFIHYLIADANGRSVVAEFINGKLELSHNDKPWQVATNFYFFGRGQNTKSRCHRYDHLYNYLQNVQGSISAEQAIELLTKVSVGGTQWSVVYNMSTKQVEIALDRDYKTIHKFQLLLKD